MSSGSPQRAGPPASFDPYLARWGLVPDGAPMSTRSSSLLPVRRDGVPAMLKIAPEAEERRGGFLMLWWDGDGAWFLGDGEHPELDLAVAELAVVELAGS